MAENPNVVSVRELPWQEWSHGEHYQTFERRLAVAMPPGKGHVGVNVQRIPPGKLNCPFHYHLMEDEFFLVLKGSVTLRHGEDVRVLREGDAVSFPRGEPRAHQFYNHSRQDCELLVIGENVRNEVCHYPDSGKWMFRAIGKVGRFTALDYWDGEPATPVLAQRRRAASRGRRRAKAGRGR